MSETIDQTRRTAEQSLTLGTEMVTVWTGIQQRLLRDWMNLSTEMVRESTRMMTDLQQNSLDGLQELQIRTWRSFSTWPDVFRDPLGWYERAVGEAVQTGRSSLSMSRAGLETMTRSMERMQETAEEAASTMQSTFREAAGRMQDVAHRADRLRVA